MLILQFTGIVFMDSSISKSLALVKTHKQPQ